MTVPEKTPDAGAGHTLKADAPTPPGTVVTHATQHETLIERAKHLAESTINYVTGGILPSFDAKNPPPFESPTNPKLEPHKSKLDPINLPPFETPGIHDLPRGFHIPKLPGLDPGGPEPTLDKTRWKPVPFEPKIPGFDPLNPGPFEKPGPYGKEPKPIGLKPDVPSPLDKPLWKPSRKEPDLPVTEPDPRFDKPLWKPKADSPLSPGVDPIKLSPFEKTPLWRPLADTPLTPGSPIALPPFESTPLWPSIKGLDPKKILLDEKKPGND